jgi:sec-independent protein translocase protein TatA
MSPAEIMIVMAIAVLIFGKRLPEVARSVGKTWAELRRMYQGVHDQITGAAMGESAPVARTVYHDDADDHEEATAPKFEPPPRPAGPPAGPKPQSTVTP